MTSLLRSLMPNRTLYKGEAIYIGKDTKKCGEETVWLYGGKHYNIKAVQNTITLRVTVDVMDSAFSHTRVTLEYPVGGVSKEWIWGEPSPSRQSWPPSRENKESVGIPPLRPVAA